MKDNKESGCLGHILFYLGVIVAPALIVRFFGLNENILPAYVICLIIGFIIGLPLGLNMFSSIKSNVIVNSLLVATIGFFTISSLALYIHISGMELFESPVASPTTSKKSSASINTVSSYKNDSTAAYYQKHYPMTWGYIYKNADHPHEYIEFYDDIWGDMQEYTGDGINFDTLTRYEQSLVDYPRIGTYVYLASPSSSTYHSTNMCYSLLKSDPVARPASQRYKYDPCSKCVGNKR